MPTTLSANPFIGNAKPPSAAEVSKVLGPSKVAWDQLLEELGDELSVGDHEWHSYSPKAGWALKVKKASRTILYMSPRSGSFLVSFALSDKAVKAAMADDLPAAILKTIREAKKYAEGTAVRIEVRAATDLGAVKKIAAAKVNN